MPEDTHLEDSLDAVEGEAPLRRTRTCCRLCMRPNRGDVIDVGGDLGRVHRSCFDAWDRRQEAIEAAEMVAQRLPDPREEWSEHDVHAPPARAA